MKIQVSLPRKTEAAITPAIDTDIDIKPRFYRRTGLVPVLYLTAIDSHGHEERYVIQLSAENKQLRISKLTEVVPAFEEKKSPKAKSTDQASDAPLEDKKDE